MEKKESPKPENKTSSRIAAFSRKLFGIIKFILGICLLPFVYSVSSSFLNEFSVVDKPLQVYFWSGSISLLIVYLFIWEPNIIYLKGQKLVEIIFSFFKPLVKVAPFLLPIYAIILFVVYCTLSYLIKSAELLNYFMFLFGFSFGLHIIFSAKTMRTKQEDFLKANYLFGFSFIYILNVFLLSLLASFLFEKFSFVNFCNYSLHTAKGIFYAVFKQLFM